MHCEKITFSDFRNIRSATLSFSEGVNILWGDNAQGKTNALEGIYCFACGKSFRGVRDRDLLRFGAASASLTLDFTDARRSQNFQLSLYAEKTRQMRKNGVPIKRSADFVGTFHGVLFCPEHLSMIKGPPQTRRSFLDAAICQLKPQYLSALSDYAKVLKQRNALLKDESRAVSARMPLYEVLTAQMAEFDAYITMTRKKYLALLSDSVDGFLCDMTGGRERVTLSYVSDATDGETDDPKSVRDAFYEKAVSYASREFAAMTTLHGCHRDDIAITLDGREARLYASQGQDRSIALAMKLGEGELSRVATGEYPVFLFDDVLSELDASRQRYLMQRLDGRQVIMTSCNYELFAGQDVNMIRVEGGAYE